MRFGFGLGLTGLRPASTSAADPLAAYYGTGMGQIPMHLRPDDAVLDGNGNVTTIGNRGGAGEAFAATATGTGMTRTGGMINKSSSASYLSLATPADMVGTRLFVVSAVAPAALGTGPRLVGRDLSATDGGRTDMNLALTNAAFALRRHDGAGMPGVLSGNFAADPGGVNRLYEIEIAQGFLRTWVNGVQATQVAWTVPNFLVDRILGGLTGPHYTGLIGDIASVITDGTPARDATMLAVRQILAAKHGIALA